jgi:hypothetical protein
LVTSQKRQEKGKTKRLNEEIHKTNDEVNNSKHRKCAETVEYIRINWLKHKQDKSIRKQDKTKHLKVEGDLSEQLWILLASELDGAVKRQTYTRGVR